MRRRAGRASLAALALAGTVALVAPWLGLRDPVARPDGLVLATRPPLSRVPVVRLADGTRRYAEEIVPEPGGSVRYRRGASWQRIPAAELAAEPTGAERFWLGTDTFGRDLASRLVWGARTSLAVGLAAALLAVLAGGAVGLAAGLGSRGVDGALMRLTDLVLSVPRLFLALLLVGLWGPSWTTTVLVLAGTTWMAAARVVRGQALSLRRSPFVVAARAAGAGPVRVALGHVLPGVAGPLAVEGVLRVADAMLLEAALSFLGLGVPPPAPSWGNLVADGRTALLHAWWISTLPGLAIAGTVVLLHGAADGLGREPGAAACSRRPTEPGRRVRRPDIRAAA